jgi:hypothetical protein
LISKKDLIERMKAREAAQEQKISPEVQKQVEEIGKRWEGMGIDFSSTAPIKEYPTQAERHKAAIIETIEEKYQKLIDARRAEDPNVTLKKEIREIDKIQTRPGGDWGYSATKITKGEKARIRQAEEEENEKNRKIYRGLYS